MIALVTAVFVASVLGSLHCVGMCGAFVAFACSGHADGSPTPRAALPMAYHGGRLLSYTLLGVAAGAAGSLLDLGGTLAGVERVALPLAGLTLAGFGVVSLLRLRGVRLAGLHPPKFMVKLVQRGQRVAMTLNPTRRALLIGLLTTLLPCGWLYAFAVTAAGTGHAWTGGLVMAVFWAGTLPALVSLGVGVRALAGPLGKRVPELTCVVLVGLGLWTLTGRSALDAVKLASAASARAESKVDAVPDANETPACCELGALLETEAGDPK